MLKKFFKIDLHFILKNIKSKSGYSQFLFYDNKHLLFNFKSRRYFANVFKYFYLQNIVQICHFKKFMLKKKQKKIIYLLKVFFPIIFERLEFIS